jgi:hypothetical protein
MLFPASNICNLQWLFSNLIYETANILN